MGLACLGRRISMCFFLKFCFWQLGMSMTDRQTDRQTDNLTHRHTHMVPAERFAALGTFERANSPISTSLQRSTCS